MKRHTNTYVSGTLNEYKLTHITNCHSIILASEDKQRESC